LGQPAAELRPIEAEIVAQHVEERRLGVGKDRFRLAIHSQNEALGHNCPGMFARKA
jgi:hypothetical protein